ncbi:hypothetical protein [Clostridium akagii]|uniref:hypothetical protein n=1 Tax=Clostridium akagii TaxID=91623 RepID=UPI00047B99BC|nr:hypothetical protein [Clostridium akagii]
MSKKPYLPRERGYMEEKTKKIKAYSKSDYTELPDPVKDPIACNNIAWQEFDYTYDETKDEPDK